MRELKSTTTSTDEFTPIRMKPLSKQWRIAARKSGCNIANQDIEAVYHMVLSKAKKLFATLPDDYSRTFIERNYKRDLRPGYAFHMHEFYNASLWIVLYCDLALQYRISYDIQYSPFQDQLTDHIQKLIKNHLNTIRHYVKPSIEDMFRKGLFSEDKDYIDTLEFKKA